MERIIPITGCFNGQVQIDYLPSINYALMLNDNKAFSKFIVQNDSACDAWENVKVEITGDMLDTCCQNVSVIPPKGQISFDEAQLMPVASKLMSLTEAVQTSFTITLTVGDSIILQQSMPLMLMAFDQWHGTSVMPEMLAAFVTPNHPCIPAICLRASRYLEEMSGRRDLDQYMTKNYQRVANQIEAVYRTVLEEDVTYITEPASFETCGQRIRLVDKVLNDKLGNCIELSLLLCSCLESIGIRTMILLFKNHAIMGAWLDPSAMIPMVGYDSKVIADCIDEDHRSLLLIEATSLTRGESLTEAIRLGEGFFHSNTNIFELYLDIQIARFNRIRPLPHCIQLEHGGWEMHDNTDYDALFDELANKNPYEIHGTATANKLKSKQQLWERKLLDLSLRNNLLNMKSGKHVVPVKDLSIDVILAHLAAEQLSADIDEKDNFATLKELYRASRVSLEENGANTLFLSVGTLRWYEVDSEKPYFAPIMFIPIEIIRHGARKYIIRVRDEEPLMNITLLEMLRQTFELEIPKLTPVPEDENDMVDWKRVFNILSTTIAEINEKRSEDTQWQIVEECMIGIFSFAKFVMWNDIHSNPTVLEQHPLLRSLMEGRLLLTDDVDTLDARTLDSKSKPSDYAIPVDVDSSQLEAVVKSGNTNSFILYGPPGTGKSQTITNMIANALYQNKRVLFVAEKKAALDVVQDRLKRIGLDPFCLELHSNKVDKKSFLSQMEVALDVPVASSPAYYDQHSEELYKKRQELNSYVEALHSERKEGLSLYDYINRYLDIEGDALSLSIADIQHLSIAQVHELATHFETLDTVENIIGIHPGVHPLLGLYPKENTAENQQQVVRCFDELPNAIISSKHKEQGLINRWFMKRTAMNILQTEDVWNRFFDVADTDSAIKENLELLEPSITSWSQNRDRLRLWYHYSLRAQEIQKYSVPSAMEYYLHGNSGKQTANAFLKGYYLRLALDVLDNDTALRSFNGMLFEDIICKYRSIAAKFQELTRQELISRLSMRTPRAETSDVNIREELTFLRKRISSQGRAYSVRRILDQTRHILPQLCPCMLMSPLSVAQYLEMRGDLFDLVIFDEASQMPTSEAVGAIARGKAAVVVGDPKQMPPTSFFTASSTNDDDADIDDLESILDDCISISLPGHYLSWHYRSKHESLIAFSNTHFYDGRLITFPSVNDQERKVTLQHVDGYYDFGKSRCNKAEAKAIVNDVIERLERMLPSEEGVDDAPEPVRSIGVVAFSKVQSNVIEDMLMDALSKRPELEKIALKGEEPLFVKNLENVQGDERDIILFSVGYGPDKNGKVSMNFGPLNQSGGERRLNVAVSRARYEMRVFSTLEPHQIDLQRTSAKGVLALKRFLEYAETGKLPCPSSQQVQMSPSPITNLIAEQLRNEGHTVHTNIGRSKFKIDIAIVDKDNPERYERGIILDGPSYFSTPTARDREIVQPKVLGLLGWNLQHKWTADYIQMSHCS
ncbi:MAG: DUF4011 domain-containing protein [Bacteroidaceae bacterium]|nr:DUF4011 domain-containing protein [Bacteroidaceae bacterium]